MKTSLLLLPAALTLGGFATAAWAESHISLSLHLGPPPPIVVPEAPPQPVVIREERHEAPGPGYVWVAGHHERHHDRWVWVEGTWAQPPEGGAYYVEGRWDERSHNWIEAHWEVGAPRNEMEFRINEPPPPPRQEVMVERPSHHHVWVAGYWVRHGHHQEWVPGHWEVPPHGHHEWIAPRYERHGDSYIFIEGQWR